MRPLLVFYQARAAGVNLTELIMKILSKWLGFLALAAAAVAFSQPVLAQDSAVDTIKKRGKLQVGFGDHGDTAHRNTL